MVNKIKPIELSDDYDTPEELKEAEHLEKHDKDICGGCGEPVYNNDLVVFHDEKMCSRCLDELKVCINCKKPFRADEGRVIAGAGFICYECTKKRG